MIEIWREIEGMDEDVGLWVTVECKSAALFYQWIPDVVLWYIVFVYAPLCSQGESEYTIPSANE